VVCHKPFVEFIADTFTGIFAPLDAGFCIVVGDEAASIANPLHIGGK
jgi:hypothetical protein